MSGSGRRTAEAFESGAVTAPVLEVTWTPGGGGGTPNAAPAVDAGPDQSVTLPATATLAGSVNDDGLPAGSVLTAVWSAVSGPGTVTFADANAARTSVSFSAAGDYVLRLTGSDGELSSSDTVAVTVGAGGGGGTVVVAESKVSAGSDDAEERASNGAMSLTSSDLELVVDGSKVQTVGLRFPALSVPAGATIVRAWVQFSTDEVKSTATNLSIAAQAADNAASFTTASHNVSSRPRTAATVGWAPSAWSTVGARGPAQQTPDLAAPLQQVVSRAGWAAGNAVVLVITGTGVRTAVASEGSAANAPVLHVEYR